MQKPPRSPELCGGFFVIAEQLFVQHTEFDILGTLGLFNAGDRSMFYLKKAIYIDIDFDSIAKRISLF